jgi:hypothetical protein
MMLADDALAVEEDDWVVVELAEPVLLALDVVADAGRLERAASATKDAVVPVTFVQTD